MVEVVVLLSRVALALVFAVAGLAKLADRRGSQQALRDFGLPPWLARPLGLLLPLAELAVAVALLLPRWVRPGAVAALVLLVMFVVGIGVSLARGRRLDCRCFGQLHSAPIGRSTLARNAILAALAGLVVWQGPGASSSSSFRWIGDVTPPQWAAFVGGLIVVAGLLAVMWLLVELLRQNGRIMARLRVAEAALGIDGESAAAAGGVSGQPAAGLPVGTTAPDFDLAGLDGHQVSLDSLRSSGHPVLLVFTDPDCGPCTELLPQIGRWQRNRAERLTIALVSRGDVEANRAKSSQQGVINVLLQQDREVAEAFQVPGTPAAVLISADGHIASPVVMGSEGIAALVTRSTGALPAASALSPLPALAASGNGPCPHCGKHHGNGEAPPTATRPSAVRVGQPAPALRLRDLQGDTLDLADFWDSPRAVLFWNPGCGFCQQMQDDLKAWEASPPHQSPKLLLISTGTVEANLAMQLRSPIVLDDRFEAGRSFGAGGTPSALLVDSQGNIASDLAVGAPDVLALLGAQQVNRQP